MSEIGDEKDFEDYLEDKDSNNLNDNSFSIIVDTIKSKMECISKTYSTTLENYVKLKELSKLENSDPMLNKLSEFIEKLIFLSLQTFNQFDYIMINDEDDDSE